MTARVAVSRFLLDFNYHSVTEDLPVKIKLTADGSPLGPATGIDGAYSAELVHLDSRLQCVKDSKVQSPSLAHAVLWGAVKDSKVCRRTYILPYIRELDEIEKDGYLTLVDGSQQALRIKWAFASDMAEMWKMRGHGNGAGSGNAFFCTPCK